MSIDSKIFLVLTFAFVLIGCKTDRNYGDTVSKDNRIDSLSGDNNNKPDTLSKGNTDKLAKAMFYLENSASMFGYVNGVFDYYTAISKLSTKKEFILDSTAREYFFVNGNKLKLNRIGSDSELFSKKINKKGFNLGDIGNSNLNSMLQLSMNRAANDTISILVSDGLFYGGRKDPLGTIKKNVRNTYENFLTRLNKGDLQTIILKMSSQFDGNYFPVSGGEVKLKQKRPYYIWVFGKNELLNKYFPNSYFESLDGFQNSARFVKTKKMDVKYEITSHNMIGSFKTKSSGDNILYDVEKYNNELQFTLAVDLSEIPFSDSYLTNTKNYSINCNDNYKIVKIRKANNVKLFGLKINPTHILYLKTLKNPYGELKVSLKNSIPKWIDDTHIESEDNIKGDEQHTFGFKYLINGILEAYNDINHGKNIASFKIELKK